MNVFVRLGILCACACRASAEFPCATDEQCRDGTIAGTCQQPIGYCSFPDDTCSSGSRFDPSAGHGLSGACVPIGDGDGGLPIDGKPAGTCFDAWMNGTVRFAAATALVATPSYERDPFESFDQLEILFSARYLGTQDIYRMTRATPGDAYGPTSIVAGLSSGANDSKVSITRDGLYLTIASGRNNGMGGADVWEATRASVGQGFGPLEQDLLGSVNTPGDEFDPIVSADGLHLYMAPTDPPPQHLVMASRATTASAFDVPVAIAELASGVQDADPAPSPDERLLVFSSVRSGSKASGNLWYAVRASPALPWGAPQPVPDLDTDDNEGDPALSSDGCTLYFSRTPLTTQNYDIYVARQVGF